MSATLHYDCTIETGDSAHLFPRLVLTIRETAVLLHYCFPVSVDRSIFTPTTAQRERENGRSDS